MENILCNYLQVVRAQKLFFDLTQGWYSCNSRIYDIFNLFEASFGELSFNANYQHSRRNAGVVSDGSHGQSRVKIQLNGDGNVNEIDASNVAILLLIPEKTYMAELFTRHASKHQTKEKVSESFTYHSMI